MTCDETEATIERAAELLLPAGSTLLCGVSGGPDSAALAAAVTRLRARLGLRRIHLGHVDHQLRATSVSDAQVAQALAANLGLPIVVRRVDVKREEGPEASARRARYLALQSMAEQLGCTHVAVGHTRTDQAETVLLRLLRGSGLAGLAAMAPSRALGPNLRLVRPLLGLTRGDVRRYAERSGVPFCEDPTNRDRRLLRNRLRLEAWPLLEEISPRLESHLAQLAERCGEDDRALEELAAMASGSALRTTAQGEVALDVAALREVPPAVARRILRRACRRAEPRAQPTAVHIGRLLAMVRSGRAAEAHVTGDLSAKLWRGDLVLAPRRRTPSAHAPFRYEILGEGLWPCPEAGLSLRIEAFAAGSDPAIPERRGLLLAPEALTFPLELRSRRPGDRFRPHRGLGTRKLKRFLIDEGIPREKRDQVPLLCSAGEILWVVGLRAAEAARRPLQGSSGWRIEVSEEQSPGSPSISS
jgi:tRNA(Ile)-lysidine synthase